MEYRRTKEVYKIIEDVEKALDITRRYKDGFREKMINEEEEGKDFRDSKNQWLMGLGRERCLEDILEYLFRKYPDID